MTVPGDELRPLLLTPETAAAMDAPGEITAAVLVPLFRREGRLHAVFTLRRSDLSHHAGEISFPGGRQDFPEEDLRRTALREAEEEIGLDPGGVELVGALPPVPTMVSNYRVYPFVGVVAPDQHWRPEPAEVDAVLELSLADLLRGFAMQRLEDRGPPFPIATYTVDGHLVWGATGRILQGLLERLGPLLEVEAP